MLPEILEQNKAVNKLITEANQIQNNRRSLSRPILAEDIFNSNVNRLQSLEPGKKIEFLRRLTKQDEAQKLLLEETDVPYYQKLRQWLALNDYQFIQQAWQDLKQYPRIKHLIAHGFLNDHLTEDQMKDCFAALELTHDCLLFEHQWEIIDFQDKNNELGNQVVQHLEKMGYIQQPLFANLLTKLKESKQNTCGWLIAKGEDDDFQKSLKSVLSLAMNGLFYSKSRALILSSALFRELLIANYTDPVLPKAVAGVSSVQSIGQSLYRNQHDYALTFPDITSLTTAHGYKHASFNIYHDNFHAWKKSTIPLTLRKAFLHCANLALKAWLYIKKNPESSINLYSQLQITCEDSANLKQSYEDLVDQEFPYAFGHLEQRPQQSFWRILQACPDKVFDLIMLDFHKNESLWKNDFGLDRHSMHSNHIPAGLLILDKIEQSQAPVQKSQLIKHTLFAPVARTHQPPVNIQELNLQ